MLLLEVQHLLCVLRMRSLSRNVRSLYLVLFVVLSLSYVQPLIVLSMSLNRKKPVTFLNKTHYFDPTSTRVKNTFLSPATYKSRQSKIEGYETRLFWQYRYCQDHGGQAFFYTLTYSDENVPKYFGKNVFDYEDLRDLLNGGFYRKLVRKYCAQLKFFVGAELGDGKGSRGLHNNPHYHVIFFLQPFEKHESEYIPISPMEFRSLVRQYWQGFDQDIDGYRDFRTSCKFGIATEGDNLGLITDYRACMYCAKYVTKDVKLVKMEKDILRYFTYKFGDEFLALDKVREFRNRYSNKVRISNGVGLYAKDFISDPYDPRIPVPSKSGFKYRPLSLYYYRKIYCCVKYDSNTGNNRYLLNDLGKQYKVMSLQRQVSRLAVKSSLNLTRLSVDSGIVSIIQRSDVNDILPSSYTHSCFVNELNELLKERTLTQISTDYAKFKLLYQNRFYRIRRDRLSNRRYHPDIDYISDCRRFVCSSSDNFKSSPVRDFLEDCHSMYLPFESHPYFLPYCRIFAMLDLFTDYLFVMDDDEAQRKAEEIAVIRRFHSKLKVQDKLTQLVFV